MTCPTKAAPGFAPRGTTAWRARRPPRRAKLARTTQQKALQSLKFASSALPVRYSPSWAALSAPSVQREPSSQSLGRRAASSARLVATATTRASVAAAGPHA
eukprot:934519-Prymnesium_polylepis.1